MFGTGKNAGISIKGLKSKRFQANFDSAMKLPFIALGLLLAVVASGQSGIIFPQLLSPSNTVLMTNAEFRTFSGAKIFFKNDAGYKSFTAPDLNTNVLTALGTSADKLSAQQSALDAANKKYLDSIIAANAAQERQKKLAIIQAANTEAAYQQQVKERESHRFDHPPNYNTPTSRESSGVGAP